MIFIGKGQAKVAVILNSLQKQRGLIDSEVQKFLGQEINYRIGFDPTHVDDSIDEGRPLAAIAPKVAISSGLKNIADKLIGNDNLRMPGRWSRLKDMIKKS